MKKVASKGETGFENAKRFTAYVIMLARSNRHVIIDQDKWPWMMNADWRRAVLDQVKEHHALLHEPGFHYPDALSAEFTFTAKSLAPSTIIENLELSESVEPDRLVSKEQAKKICWYCFLALGILIAASIGSCYQRNQPEPTPTVRSLP